MEDKKTNVSAKKKTKDIFSAKNITRLAVFTALAYAFYFLEFSVIPAVPFLKVDFSNAFVMISAFAMGPIAGLIVGALKELLHAVTISQTFGVGELANIIIMLPYILIPAFIYKKRKGIKTALVSLSIACVAQAVWSIPVNYLLTFPFFLVAGGAESWKVGMDLYLTVWYWAVLFNFVKTVLVSAVVLLLYKNLSKFFDMLFGERKIKGNHTYTVKSPAKMEKLGKSLASELKGGEVLLLSGELGAGKTVFCKGLAKGLGVTAPVVSPTFTLMNEYFGRVKFCHFDAYRLSDADEAYGAGLTDFIGADGIVCAVEWWENVPELFDGCKVIKVDIKKTDNDAREVRIER